jgi:hypothetical protein
METTEADIEAAMALTNEHTNGSSHEKHETTIADLAAEQAAVLNAPKSERTYSGGMTSEQIAAVEATFVGPRKGTKLTVEEKFRGELGRNVDPNAPQYKIVPHGYKSPGKFADFEADIASLEAADANVGFSKLTATEVSKQLLAELEAKDKVETERQSLLSSEPVKAKITAVAALIERARWDDRYEAAEFQSLVNAQRQITEGDIDTGAKMIDDCLLIEKQKINATLQEVAAAISAIDAQRDQLAAEKKRLAKLAGVEIEEPIYSDPADVDAARKEWERLMARDDADGKWSVEQGIAFNKYQKLRDNLPPA